jgi:long-chain acyl-CoA synthetase
MSATATAVRPPDESTPPRPATLNQLFFEAVQRFDKPNALQAKIGGRYQPVSHRTIGERVRRVALGLRAIGVEANGRVAILSENRPEWAIADYGCLTAGIVDVPIYTTLPPEQIAYILRDSGAEVIFCSTEELARKVISVRGELPGLHHIIGFDVGEPLVDLSLSALEALGAGREATTGATAYREAALSVAPDELATIIYTSGTTGDAKGAMLTHGNIASNVAAVMNVLPFGSDDVSLSFLPLSHIFERMFDYFMFAVGVSIAYVESMDTILANLSEVRPTIVTSVPRIYEKIYSRVLENALAGSHVRRAMFFWAKDVGERWARESLAGRRPPPLLALQYALASRLVFAKLRARVGGRMRYFVSGGAPLATEINLFFYSAGLPIFEGYGLTETSPVISVNTPQHYRIGTVGHPIENVEVRIAVDGEILTRGPHVMRGYYNKPEATREAIDEDGWFRTGDIGELEDGFLRITDRKKDIIVTANGKNIAPQPIENLIKTNKYVSQAVIIGDRRKYPIVLVVPNFDQLEQWARYKQLGFPDRRHLLTLPLVRAKMDKEVLGRLTSLAAFETPKKVVLLEHDFSIEGGELTPTLKVKRRVVDKRYKSLIDAQYVEEGRA